jgi:hypothetical protein
MMEREEKGIAITRIGINVRRHKELIHRLYELIETSGIGPDTSTSQLIDTIADEPTFTKKECVYLGLYLASINDSDEHVHTDGENLFRWNNIRPSFSRAT